MTTPLATELLTLFGRLEAVRVVLLQEINRLSSGTLSPSPSASLTALVAQLAQVEPGEGGGGDYFTAITAALLANAALIGNTLSDLDATETERNLAALDLQMEILGQLLDEEEP